MSAARLAIAGCTGRMGVELVRLAAADPEFELVAALTEQGDARIGDDAGSAAGVDPVGIAVATACDAPCDVLVEFTLPAGCRQWAQWCADNGVALVSGTTGLSAEDRAVLQQAARAVPVLWAPNMSVGVNLLLKLVADAAAALDESWDVEIVESHHRRKVDAPSGTARALLESVCKSRGVEPPSVVVHGRSGETGQRPRGQIGVHALRMGDVVGEHEVYFAIDGESLLLRHRATSRRTFAAGALRAAKWLPGRPAGMYMMADVLARAD